MSILSNTRFWFIPLGILGLLTLKFAGRPFFDPEPSTVPENRAVAEVERARTILADIFQVARLTALEARSNSVAIVRTLAVADYGDLEILTLPLHPTAEQPVVNGIYILPLSAHAAVDAELKSLKTAPMLAWPVRAEKEAEIPVLLGHPADGFRLGAKPLRLRWMSSAALEIFKTNPAEKIDLHEWPWFEKSAVVRRLANDG
ncbi:MAG: hypothetical protein AAF492_14510 [Verrucomicrobiota bacterium]